MRNETPFEQALTEVWIDEYRDVPPEEELHHAFSPEFEAKMEALFRKVRKNHWKRSKVILRRVALVAAIIAALLLTACTIPAVRQVFKDLFVDFFVEDKETFYEFTYDPDEVVNAPDCIETVYAPTYVPEGFAEDARYCNIAGAGVVWYNEDNVCISFSQSIMPADPMDVSGTGYNAENATLEWIPLGGGQVLRLENEWHLMYIWATNEYRFDLICSKEFPEEELQKIFNSIQIDEAAVIDGADEYSN